MTALARAESSSADPINKGKNNINDRKFAFLNQITRPDYRSREGSIATSQSSVPSTPVSIPLQSNGEQLMFREFGAPIATPEDEELLDDLEIKSEPLLSPRRFDDFVDRNSEEKENREDVEEEDDDTEADTTIREDIRNDEEEKLDEKASDNQLESTLQGNNQTPDDVSNKDANSENVSEEAPTSDVISKLEYPSEVSEDQKTSEANSTPHDFIRMVESAPELTATTRLSPEEEIEAEEIRKMTESFGEPRKAVLERVCDNFGETDDDETETETETENEEEDYDDDVQRQIAAVSDDVPMVFGWNGKKEKVEKPTSLPLHYEVEADCSTPRRAEFSLDPDDDTVSEDPQAASSGDEGVLQQSLIQLQKQLRKTDVRCSRLEKICEFQQRDIDSLRFEVDWKDKRIEYLQKTLQEMEMTQSTDATSSRSTSTS